MPLCLCGKIFFGNWKYELMLKKLYAVFAVGIIGIYTVASFMGWELANDGRNSRLGLPFVSGGYRGGK